MRMTLKSLAQGPEGELVLVDYIIPGVARGGILGTLVRPSRRVLGRMSGKQLSSSTRREGTR